MDKDGDGQISLEEFAAVAQTLNLGVGSSSSEPTPKRFSRQGSQLSSRRSPTGKRTPDPALQRRALAIFDRIDTDESGTINRSELQNLLRQLYPDQTEDATQLMTQQLMSVLDSDGDNNVTRSEFTAAVASGHLDALLEVSRISEGGKWIFPTHPR